MSEPRAGYAEKRDWSFEVRYPRWRCPDCSAMNRYVNTFFETCRSCKADHTLDWVEHKLDPEAP